MTYVHFTAYASYNENSRKFCCNLVFKEFIDVELHDMENINTQVSFSFFPLAAVYIVFFRSYVQFWKHIQ